MRGISRRDFLKSVVAGGVGMTALRLTEGITVAQTISSPWPEGCEGAFSLSFDDGSQSQLDIAIPILEEYDLLGTFYINPRGDDWEERLAPWSKIAARGHELGNHTIDHICSRNFAWGPNVKSLETTTLDEIEADVLKAEERLKELTPEQPIRTFCYPCYQNFIGEGPTRQSYVPVIAKHFPAARGMGEAANHPEFTDLHYLTSWTAAGWMSGPQLCGFANTAMKQGRWGILALHGLQEEPGVPWIPGSYYHGSALSADSLRGLCECLVENRERLWTATVLEIAQRLTAWREGLEVQKSTE